MSPEKRPDRAIEVAKRAGIPLKIAAKVDPSEVTYFEQIIKPLLDHPLIEFIGEIGDHEKQEFLGNALALLFPIDWPEPFGLVMIEAMAVGTPVIAWRAGSVPEVIDDGLSGLVVESMDEMVAAVDACTGHEPRGRARALRGALHGGEDGARPTCAPTERCLAMRGEPRSRARSAASSSRSSSTDVPQIAVRAVANDGRRLSAADRAEHAPNRAGRIMARSRAQDDGPRPSASSTASANVWSEYEIEAQTSLVDRPLRNLKHADAFAVLDAHGDIGAVQDTAEGLFYRDTRYLSRFELRIEGRSRCSSAPSRSRTSRRWRSI